MTSSEIIKALECCGRHKNRDCQSCPLRAQSIGCGTELYIQALNLIKRQKSQLERLKRYDEKRDIALHARLISTAKAETINDGGQKWLKRNK
ncbi:MAG: hypothetical protein ACI4F7_05690 [Acutalibacteraceae bacterium]